jgi:hypothetical protein
LGKKITYILTKWRKKVIHMQQKASVNPPGKISADTLALSVYKALVTLTAVVLSCPHFAV